MVLATFVISIFIFLLLGVPIAFSILMTIVVLVTTSGVSSYAIVPTYLYSGVNSFSLMAIPFFTLCGELMNAGNLSQGIVDFCRCLLGHIKAGLGYAAILACMLFACLSGAAVNSPLSRGGFPKLAAAGNHYRASHGKMEYFSVIFSQRRTPTFRSS